MEVAALEGFLLLVAYEGELAGAGVALVLSLEFLLVACVLLVLSLPLVPLLPIRLLLGSYLVQVVLDDLVHVLAGICAFYGRLNQRNACHHVVISLVAEALDSPLSLVQVLLVLDGSDLEHADCNLSISNTEVVASVALII